VAQIKPTAEYLDAANPVRGQSRKVQLVRHRRTFIDRYDFERKWGIGGQHRDFLQEAAERRPVVKEGCDDSDLHYRHCSDRRLT
jgi:hypothetical protein